MECETVLKLTERTLGHFRSANFVNIQIRIYVYVSSIYLKLYAIVYKNTNFSFRIDI